MSPSLVGARKYTSQITHFYIAGRGKLSRDGANLKRRLVWFSCGAASAVAAKLAVETYGDAVDVVYCDTLATEHPDNERFLRDVERWIGRSVTRQSRAIGARLVRLGVDRENLKGRRVFLDELPPDADGPDDLIDCGPVCQASR